MVILLTLRNQFVHSLIILMRVPRASCSVLPKMSFVLATKNPWQKVLSRGTSFVVRLLILSHTRKHSQIQIN